MDHKISISKRSHPSKAYHVAKLPRQTKVATLRSEDGSILKSRRVDEEERVKEAEELDLDKSEIDWKVHELRTKDNTVLSSYTGSTKKLEDGTHYILLVDEGRSSLSAYPISTLTEFRKDLNRRAPVETDLDELPKGKSNVEIYYNNLKRTDKRRLDSSRKGKKEKKLKIDEEVIAERPDFDETVDDDEEDFNPSSFGGFESSTMMANAKFELEQDSSNKRPLTREGKKMNKMLQQIVSDSEDGESEEDDEDDSEEEEAKNPATTTPSKGAGMSQRSETNSAMGSEGPTRVGMIMNKSSPGSPSTTIKPTKVTNDMVIQILRKEKKLDLSKLVKKLEKKFGLTKEYLKSCKELGDITREVCDHLDGGYVTLKREYKDMTGSRGNRR